MSQDELMHKILYPALFIIVCYIVMRGLGIIGKSKKDDKQ
jgi:hypothetical protein